MHRNETRLYSIVERYLKGKGYLITDVRKGRKAQADVVGVKDSGHRYSNEIEVVAVEVKDREKVRDRYITQALGYSRYAHKCYLAMPATYDEEVIADAKERGVGLLEIRGNKVREVLPADFKHPKESELIWFLRKSLGLVRCAICGCIFELGKTTGITRRNAFGNKKRLYICIQCCSNFGISYRRRSTRESA
jgi:hypothetical protein